MKYTKTPRKWKDLDDSTSNSDEILTGKIYYPEISEHYDIYDYAEITNLNIENDCIIILNGSKQIPLPKGNQSVLNFPFRTIAIKNNGSTTINANEINIFYSHKSKKADFIDKGLSVLRWF